MNIKHCVASAILAVAFSAAAHASVTINFEGGKLFGASVSQPIPDGSLIVFVVSTDGTFTGAEVGSFTTGTELVIGSGSADSGVLGEPGGFSIALNFNLTGGIIAGQVIEMRWFPSISDIGAVPTDGVTYGSYSDLTWVVPADGNLVSYSFESEAVGGAIPDSTAVANITIGSAIPEPSSFAALAGLGILGVVATRRRRSA